MEHIEYNNVPCTQQYGFIRKHRSCERQLILELVEELMENVEGGRQTDILIMDFVKAFDKVNHSLLLHLSYVTTASAVRPTGGSVVVP